MKMEGVYRWFGGSIGWGHGEKVSCSDPSDGVGYIYQSSVFINGWIMGFDVDLGIRAA